MPHKNLYNNKYPKAFFRRYLKNIDEPKYISSTGAAKPVKTELIEDSYVMRRRFRLIAKTLRDYF